MGRRSQRYRHASILADGAELLETESFTVNVKSRATKVLTGGHRGSRPPKNKSLEATISMKFQVPVDGPEYNFLRSIERGDPLDVSVVDPLFGGEYDVEVDDCGMDDDFSGGEAGYTVNCSGYKVS
jgi:hypothetical protein